MSAVVGEGELFAVVDAAAAVKLAVGFGKRVGYHTRGGSGGLARQKFQALARAFAGCNELVPIAAKSHITHAVLVFEHIVHLLVISLDGKFVTLYPCAIYADAVLCGAFRLDVLGDGHPKVCRHCDRRGRKHVDALAHHRHRRLDIPISIEDVFEREARLIIVVTLALHVENRVCKSGIDVEMVVYLPIVLYIKAELVGKNFLAGGRISGIISFVSVLVFVAEGGGLRHKIVVDVVGSKLDGMFWRRHIVEVYRRAPIDDFAAVRRRAVGIVLCADVGLVVIRPKFHTVMIVRNSGVGKKFLGKDVVPTQGRDSIAPFHIGAVFVVIMIPIVLIIVVILILTVVKSEENPVLVRKLVVDFGVEVIKPIRKLAV